jgi:hypothetical protein
METLENDIQDMLQELSGRRPSEIAACLSVPGLNVLQSAYQSFLSYASCGEANASFYTERVDAKSEKDLMCLEVYALLDNYAAQRPRRYFLGAAGSFDILSLP